MQHAVVDNTPVRTHTPGGRKPWYLMDAIADPAMARKRAIAQDAANRLARMNLNSEAVLKILLRQYAHDSVILAMAMRIAGL